MEKVTRNDTIVAKYSYLSDGTKLSATDAAGDGLYYAGSLVYRKRSGGYSLESAAFGEGRIVATDGGYEARYHLTDHLGSVRAIVNDKGDVLERNDYYPFGLRWADSGSQLSDNRYRYNAKEEQSFVGVPYLDYGARQYDPRFRLSWNEPDPLAEKSGSVTPYAFCGGNPIVRIDPDGRHWIRNITTDSYEWRDDVTSVQHTPDGYEYVGSHDQDIVSNLGLLHSYENYDKIHTISVGGESDALSQPAIQTRSGSIFSLIVTNLEGLSGKIATGHLDLKADVSYGEATNNNESGRNFEGMTISAIYSQPGGNPAGTVQVTNNGKRIIRQLRLPEPPYIKSPDRSVLVGDIHIPAIHLKPGSLKNGYIGIGNTGANYIHKTSVNIPFDF